MAEPDTPPRTSDTAGQPSRVDRQRRIDAPPGRVWRVFEHPDLRREMLGGDLDVDLEPGATGTFDDGATTRPVRIDDVDPPRRLAFEWGAGADASQVDIRLVPAEDGTDVHVTEILGGRPSSHLAVPSEPTALALAA